MISPVQFVRSTRFRPKKQLGQNFLVHAESAVKIVRFAGVKPGDHVLEIGPGLGALTGALLGAGADVTAIEKDAALVKALTGHGFPEERFHLVRGDALTYDLDTISGLAPVKVVSNPPYSISTPILEILMARFDLFPEMCLLLQAEVVRRVCATPGNGDWGRLSIWVQTLCETESGPRIPQGSFYPQPDVESRLVKIRRREKSLVPEGELEAFLKFTAVLFQHRRKTLRNSLRTGGFDAARADEALGSLGIDPGRRPETLTIPEIHALTCKLTPI